MRPAPLDQKILEEAVACMKIQKAVRFFQAKKFKIKPLPVDKQSPGFVYSVGNDPDVVIPDELKSKDQFALVCTSGLRVLDIAALFSENQANFIPKIFVVDINPEVKEFWIIIKTIFNCSQSLSDLFSNFENNKKLLREVLKSESEDELEFYLSRMLTLLVGVFNKFGFDHLKKMINNLVSITHDWTDPNVFHKIKNICDRVGLNNIYTYTSNIMDCISSEAHLRDQPNVLQMLKNISILNPRASIFSNLDIEKKSPTKMICYSGSPTLDQLEIEFGERTGLKKYISKLTKVFADKFRSKDFSGAFISAKRAYEIYSNLPNISDRLEKAELSDLAHNLGATLQELGKFNEALVFLNRAFKLREEVNHPKKQATADRLQRIYHIIMTATTSASPSL